jgi:hypothetical protein
MNDELDEEEEEERDDPDLPTSDLGEMSLESPKLEGGSKCAVCLVPSKKHCVRCKKVHCESKCSSITLPN